MGGGSNNNSFEKSEGKDNVSQNIPNSGDNNLSTSGEVKDTKQVKIVLQSSHDNRTTVLAKPTTKISRLLSAFCKERNVNPKEYRLVFKGKVLQEDADVSTYNISNEDVIEVLASQTGGSLYMEIVD